MPRHPLKAHTSTEPQLPHRGPKPPASRQDIEHATSNLEGACLKKAELRRAEDLKRRRKVAWLNPSTISSCSGTRSCRGASRSTPAHDNDTLASHNTATRVLSSSSRSAVLDSGFAPMPQTPPPGAERSRPTGTCSRSCPSSSLSVGSPPIVPLPLAPPLARLLVVAAPTSQETWLADGGRNAPCAPTWSRRDTEAGRGRTRCGGLSRSN
jgi:hypothetical protein